MTELIALLDGNALVHRAFHALPPLTSPKGELVNATYGFTMMLLRALQDLHPTHVAAAFDTPKPTFRHERFDAYKGTRPPTPDGLGHQFATVFEVLEALKIPVYQLDGLEADDLLGTMADRSVEAGLDVIVITGDTDALQLVGPHVRVLVPRRGLTDTVTYDEAAVYERYGLEPQQLVDLRALRGDVTDNIPGVPGIGEKTASKLLAAYGSVDSILANLDKLPPKQAAQLRPYAEQMELSRSLAQIIRDAPLAFDVTSARCDPRIASMSCGCSMSWASAVSSSGFPVASPRPNRRVYRPPGRGISSIPRSERLATWRQRVGAWPARSTIWRSTPRESLRVARP